MRLKVHLGLTHLQALGSRTLASELFVPATGGSLGACRASMALYYESSSSCRTLGVCVDLSTARHPWRRKPPNDRRLESLTLNQGHFGGCNGSTSRSLYLDCTRPAKELWILFVHQMLTNVVGTRLTYPEQCVL